MWGIGLMFKKKAQAAETLVIVVGIMVLLMFVVGVFFSFQLDFRLKKASRKITSQHAENIGDIILLNYLRTPYNVGSAQNIADLITISAGNNNYGALDSATRKIFDALLEDKCYFVIIGEHEIKGDDCSYNVETSILLPADKDVKVTIKMKNEVTKK